VRSGQDDKVGAVCVVGVVSIAGIGSFAGRGVYGSGRVEDSKSVAAVLF
jgi:hypothetical protein